MNGADRGSFSIGSLFSGIGGLELGLEWAGVGRTVWQVERDPFCRAVLAKHWADVERHEDVRAVGRHNLAPVEVICGGFPCQDISYAGRGAGLAGERSGLWYEYARIVRELRPRFVVVENVSALLTRGLDAVLGTMASLGYDAEWSCVRASDVGARHRRERVFVVAWLSDADRARPSLDAQPGRLQPALTLPASGGQLADPGRGGVEHRRGAGDVAGAARSGEGEGDQRQRNGNAAGDGREAALVNADRERCGGQRREVEQDAANNGERCPRSEQNARPCDARSGPQRGVGRAAHGLSARLDVAGPNEPQHAWEAPRTSPECVDRAARLRALGNAVVPQVAEVVGRRLLELATGRAAA